MKCQNCGENYANYHYTSNINGVTTESHLCSECAQKLRMENKFNSQARGIIDGMFTMPMFGGLGRMQLLPWDKLGYFMIPAAFATDLDAVQGAAADTDVGAGAETAEKKVVSNPERVDPEMQRRREINMLRSQLQEAVSTEEFERAAELRDKIKEIENEE
jgi:protein arginine kinase activator